MNYRLVKEYRNNLLFALYYPAMARWLADRKNNGFTHYPFNTFEGFSAKTAGALTLFGTSALGIPVSTTHTIAGASLSAGATKRLNAVR